MARELTENQKKWIAALRSGEYKQGKRRLKNEDGTYCCLGVMADLARKDGVKSSIEVEDCTLPMICHKEWVGLRNIYGDPVDNTKPGLTVMNDNLGFTFEMIADHLEQHADLYFVEPTE